MNDPIKHSALAAAGLLLAGSSAAVLRAQEAGGAVSDGVYTEVQAERGQVAYVKYCRTCHADTMAGIDSAPALVGGTFLGDWVGQSVSDLADRIRMTMPLSNPGTLSSATVSDIISWILKVNGYVAGATELPRDGQLQQTIRIDAPKRAD